MMAARVWLHCIHSGDHVERLDGQRYWSGKHSLGQRNAACNWRRCRSVASQRFRRHPTLSDNLARSTTRDWASLLQIPAFRLLLMIAALVEGSHALHDLFSVIRWRAAGVGFPVISALWSESCVIRGSGLPIDRTAIGSDARPRWGNRPGSGGGDYPLDCCGLHHLANPLGVRAAPAWVHVRTAALGSHAGDRAGIDTPFGCDSASHLRHIMHRAGHGFADPAFRPALWSDRRHRISRHGCALFAGAAYVRSIAAILWKLTTMLSTNTMRG